MERVQAPSVIGMVCLIAGLLALASPPPASATVTHRVEGSFNGSDSPTGPFGILLSSDAVDQSTGTVWIGESDFEGFGHGVVTAFTAGGVYAGVQINGATTPNGSFAFAFHGSGVAVDNSLGVNGGDVYVADTDHQVLDRFSPTGEFLCQITGKRPTTLEEQEHECNGAAGSETPAGAIAPAGVAVDSSGDLYVADDAHAVIDEFGPAGDYITDFSSPDLSSEMGSVAVDAAGDVYVANYPAEGPSDVIKIAAGQATIFASEARAVAVDPANGHVYTSENREGAATVVEREPSGVVLAQARPEGTTPQSFLLSVTGAGKIYAAEEQTHNAAVQILGPDVTIPTVSTEPASNVTSTSATLNATVDPDTAHGGGAVSTCVFEYGTSTAYGQTAPCSPATPYSSATSVSAAISISANTGYHFRVKASDAEGSSDGQDQTVTTPGPPAIDSSEATAQTTSAIIHAQIRPDGAQTSCQLQFIAQAQFQAMGYAGAQTLPCEPANLGSGSSDQGATVTLGSLPLDSTYHWRLIASNPYGTTTGVDQTLATFGIREFSLRLLGPHGEPYTQAGGHPYEMQTEFTLNTSERFGQRAVDANLKNVETELPPGLIANPTATAKCTRAQLAEFECSGAAQVGVLKVSGPGGAQPLEGGLYNMVAPAGVPAEFGARLNTFLSVFVDAAVRTGGDYGITAMSLNNSTSAGIGTVTLEIWGVPADPRHDPTRRCPAGEGKWVLGCSAEAPSAPLLTTPTSCDGAPSPMLRVDSWQEPGRFVSATSAMPEFTGCAALGFTPSIEARPDSAVADAPSGLHVAVADPQPEGPSGDSEADVRSVRVAFPDDLSISPSAAASLQACAPGQISLGSAEPVLCPEASRIGTVEIITPLLPDPEKGYVYMAQQGNNPFGSPFAIYVAAQSDGALIKLAGHVIADPTTGQLTTIFEDLPQLPFTAVRMDLFDGPRALIATPQRCGIYSAEAALGSWSIAAPMSLVAPQFTISTGCVGGFEPSFTAGATTAGAGAYAPFVLSLARSDADQTFAGLSVSLPPGLLAKVAGVPWCPDAEAQTGDCPEGSQVGSATVGAGPGPEPLLLPGKVYLTGPYKGAPYGLAVVVPAIAGPFDLGTVVVRQALEIDRADAHVTLVSDPFPTILAGVPIRLRRIDVDIDRPGFTVNPTSCAPMAVAGTAHSTEGATATLSSRFQAGGCASLPFHPSLSASTQGHAGPTGSTTLTVKVSYPAGAIGHEANVRQVKIALPKQLPARLTTLQKACIASQFETDPAGCPDESIVGHARVTTPLLPNALEGPAYLVSHGAIAFPSLAIVLQADGVTVELVGATSIGNAGVMTTTFSTIPDVPFDTFELTLPQGRYSALAANANFCSRTRLVKVEKHVTVHSRGHTRHLLRTTIQRVRAPLIMPTELTGQNGVRLRQNTAIAILGCAARRKAATKAKSRPAHNHVGLPTGAPRVRLQRRSSPMP